MHIMYVDNLHTDECYGAAELNNAVHIMSTL